MKVQYVLDSKGQATGVFIPIKEWNVIKRKYKDIEEEEISVPGWHKDLVLQRLKDYEQNPGSALNFDATMDDIEKEL